jgi:hypothetical protein
MASYYAGDDQISRKPIKGGIRITEEEYVVLLDGMMNGKKVVVEDKVAKLVDPPVEE